MIIFFVVQNRRPEQVQYLTEQVRRGDLVVTVSATGTLAPVKEVQVGIEVSGTIKSVLVDYNDRVTVGQVLAVLDTTRLEAQALQSGSALASARAKVVQAEATLQEAQLKMARLNQLKELSGGKVPALYRSGYGKSNPGQSQSRSGERQSRCRASSGRFECEPYRYKKGCHPFPD